jgi:PAS domain S-box-containing protein
MVAVRSSAFLFVLKDSPSVNQSDSNQSDSQPARSGPSEHSTRRAGKGGISLHKRLGGISRRRLENDLNESERRFRSLLGSIDEGFCVIEMLFDDHGLPFDYRFLELTPAFEEQTGLKGALGKRISELIPNHDLHWYEAYSKVAVTGELHRFEVYSVTLQRWFSVSAFRVGRAEEHKVALLVANISGRKQAEAELAEKQRMMELSNDAIIARDMSGDITLWNQGAERIYEWKAEEAIGKPLHELLQTELPEPMGEILGKVEREGHFTADVVQTARGGKRIPSLCRWALDEETETIVTSYTDISDRLQAERDLAEKARLLDLSNDAIIVRDQEGNIEQWNKGAEKMFGWSCEEVIGKNLQELLQSSFPKPKEEIAADLQREGFFAGEVIQTARDGRQVLTLCRWVLDQETHSILTSFTDISAITQAQQALRESEEKFRTLFEAMDQGYCIVEVLFDDAGEAYDYRFLDANVAFKQHSGLPEPEGRTIRELAPDIEPKWFQIYGKVAQTGESVRLVDQSAALGRWFDLYAYRIGEGGNRVAIHFDDITERKRSEDALRESDERVRLATEATGVGIWEWDVATTDICWDAEMFRIFGVTPTPDGMVPYSAWSQAVLPSELPQQEELLRETVRRRGKSTREFYIRRANDGELRLIRGVETARTSANGKVEWVVGTNLDVTEQKQAEEAIRKSEERFRAAVGIATSIIWTNNAEGMMEGEQVGWENFTGQSQEEYSGYGWSAAIHPEDAQATVDAWKQAVAEQRLFEFEHRVRRRDGEWRQCSIRALPLFDSDGTLREWVGVHTDITESKRAEETLRQANDKLESVLSSITDGLVVLNRDWNFTYINEQGARLLGIRPEDFIGKNMWEIYPHAQHLKFYEAYHRAIDSRQALHFEEYYPEPLNIWIECHCYPTEHELSVYFRDITARKQAEESVRTLNQELESRVVERTAELRAAVAKVEKEIDKRRRLEREILEIAEREQSRLGQDLHDGLGQELAGISLLSNALANDLETAAHSSAKAAANIAKYTNSTIESARRLARGLYPIELSRRGLLFALEDLAELTNLRTSVSCELRSEGLAAGLKPSTEIHIYRIVQECISNAIKHGKASRITIELLTRGEFYIVAVTDNGVGFAGSSDSGGMGLHLMEYRARLIGAQIEINNPIGGGCRVECRLPAL